MKKLLKSSLVILSIITPQIVNAFWFNGAYEYTTGRGEKIGGTAATIGEIGDWFQILIPLSAAIYSTSIRDWKGDLQLAESYAATWATTEILKYTVNEERPNAPDNTKGHTFPSGHTSSAFAGAAYWQRRYGWYIGAPMYAAAAFVGYSRVRTKKHNWTDVAVGATLGIGFNYLFTSRYTPNGVSISVEPTDGGAYFHFKTRF